MKKELKDLLQVLLQSIITSGKVGINNTIMDVDVDAVDYYYNYLIIALTELKHLKDGEEVDFENVKDAYCDCMGMGCDKVTKADVKYLIEWYNHTDDGSGEYHPSDEILNELVNLIEK